MAFPVPFLMRDNNYLREHHPPSKMLSMEDRQELIDQMVAVIVRRFEPERIILFGSHARGDWGPDSDIDLLVVMRFAGPKREQQVRIRAALRQFRAPKDIIVTTPDDFAWRKDVVGTIEWPATREGKVLYARA
jgi:predicted nucleotidyltransferase